MALDHPTERNDFAIRLLSAALLAAAALLGAWLGGLVAGIVVAVAAVVAYYEWSTVTRTLQAVPPLVVPIAVAAAMIVGGLGHLDIAAAIIALTAFGTAIASRGVWQPAGILYVGIFGLPLLGLRLSPELGLTAIFFLFAVAWVTDTGAYIAGRNIGGPKLWPAISPNKTWAGAIGGFAAAIAAAALVAVVAGIPVTTMLLVVAAILSVACQIGDLFESFVKRRFDVKDSGNIIPGHGGLMDRVDGLIFAGLAAFLTGWLNGGPGHLAEGLLRW